MLIETKISKGYSTVVPAYVRKKMDIEPGDILIWELEGRELKVLPRKNVELENIIGIIDEGGDAVESKKKVQRGMK
ncbi:MAG: AbrB/MazE/SpoVT family DNA-binding domain-containing protein [Candidatus Thermoplasmatota archaeon]|nr:AbrB/MazE/SpoVT family DNA-binding domain-containing protein [Candidatus Thermoplasmatota archaeon]MDP7263934.1 AbrB/MazE/SpoVT family DNA-binding domain-containing protein [Candidatus Thermoplasmatota archaeon]